MKCQMCESEYDETTYKSCPFCKVGGDKKERNNKNDNDYFQSGEIYINCGLAFKASIKDSEEIVELVKDRVPSCFVKISGSRLRINEETEEQEEKLKEINKRIDRNEGVNQKVDSLKIKVDCLNQKISIVESLLNKVENTEKQLGKLAFRVHIMTELFGLSDQKLKSLLKKLEKKIEDQTEEIISDCEGGNS